jgi:hypothetical protein
MRQAGRRRNREKKIGLIDCHGVTLRDLQDVFLTAVSRPN